MSLSYRLSKTMDNLVLLLLTLFPYKTKCHRSFHLVLDKTLSKFYFPSVSYHLRYFPSHNLMVNILNIQYVIYSAYLLSYYERCNGLFQEAIIDVYERWHLSWGGLMVGDNLQHQYMCRLECQWSCQLDKAWLYLFHHNLLHTIYKYSINQFYNINIIAMPYVCLNISDWLTWTCTRGAQYS